MGIVEKRDKHKNSRYVSPEKKLEGELKDCMHCKFFWGHNNRCANGICVKPTKKREISIPAFLLRGCVRNEAALRRRDRLFCRIRCSLPA